MFTLDVEYARFNALKTVADPRESEFSVAQVGPLIVTRDPARDATYYHRIVGCTPPALPWLDPALECFDGAVPAPRIDTDVRDASLLEGPLCGRGFVPRAELVWLEARTGRHATSVPVVRLGRDDVDRVREILELGGPVDSELWARRRHHQCTERFRAFGIEAGGQLVAMATTFVGEQGVILGNAFTREEWRGRGYQRALLAARLTDAYESGFGSVVTDVEPGTASLRNCERLGFTERVRLSLWEGAG